MRPGAELPQACLRPLNRLAMEARADFNQLVEDLAPQGPAGLDWLLTGPGSRNTLACPLYLRCCCLLLLRELLDQRRRVARVVTDSPAQAALAREIIAQAGAETEVVCTGGPMARALAYVYTRALCLADLALALWGFACARLTRGPRRPDLPEEPLTLLDTFVSSEDTQREHYYPGLLDHLESERKKSVSFVPTVTGLGFGKLWRVYSALRSGSRPCLFKEDYLRPTDILAAWLRALGSARMPLGAARFRGLAATSLAREELARYAAFGSLVVGLMNLRFAQRLAQAGVRVRAVVDWFENQAVDKGFNAGFRQAYPAAWRAGYMGALASPLYLCLSPTPLEERLGVLPARLCGVGPGSADIIQEFLPGMPVLPGLALRNAQPACARPRTRSAADRFVVLAALPLRVCDSVTVLTMVARVLPSLPASVRILVKAHPLASLDKLSQAFGRQWPAAFTFIGGGIAEAISQSDFMVSMESSTALDAISMGVGVAIAANGAGFTLDPVPTRFVSALHTVCFTPEDLLQAIAGQIGADDAQRALQAQQAEAFRRGYFTAPTRQSVLALLGWGDAAHPQAPN